MINGNTPDNSEKERRILNSRSSSISKTSIKSFQYGHSDNVILDFNMVPSEAFKMMKHCLEKYFSDIQEFADLFDARGNLSKEANFTEFKDTFEHLEIRLYGENLLLIDIKLRDEGHLILNNMVLFKAIIEYVNEKEAQENAN